MPNLNTSNLIKGAHMKIFTDFLDSLVKLGLDVRYQGIFDINHNYHLNFHFFETNGNQNSYSYRFDNQEFITSNQSVNLLMDFLIKAGILSHRINVSPLQMVDGWNNIAYMFNFDSCLNLTDITTQPWQPFPPLQKPTKSHIRSLPTITPSMVGSTIDWLLDALSYAEDTYQTITGAHYTPGPLNAHRITIEFNNRLIEITFDNRGDITTYGANVEQLLNLAFKGNFRSSGISYIVHTDKVEYTFHFTISGNFNGATKQYLPTELNMNIPVASQPEKSSVKCTCNFDDLLRNGCKCGAFKKEMENRK